MRDWPLKVTFVWEVANTNVPFAIFSVFSSRVNSFHDPQTESTGVIPSIFQALKKYNLISYFYNLAATSCFLLLILGKSLLS